MVSNVSVSEIYIVPEDLDPEKLDPVETGNFKPLSSCMTGKKTRLIKRKLRSEA